MGNIKNASKIDLSNKGLTEIPNYIFECKNLKVLNLSHNNLKELPVQLSQLKQLKKLDVSNNSLNHILSKSFDLKSLEILNLNNNFIRSIPKQIEKLKRLKGLFLSGNQLESLPDEIGVLHNLKTLNISNNKFRLFPSAILNLKELTHLWIGKNLIELIPIHKVYEHLSKLKALYSFNPLVNQIFSDNNTTLLLKQKGNSINTLRLMTYKTSAPDEKPSLDISKGNIAPNIFISYSHKDKRYKEEVVVTLKALKHVFPKIQFEYWSDDKIRSGQDSLKEIGDAMDKAGIAILIVSRYFLASEFIMKKEIPTILENAEKRGTVIISLIAGQCLFTDSFIGKYQSVNDPIRPLKSLGEHEQEVVYNKLAQDIEFYLIGNKL